MSHFLQILIDNQALLCTAGALLISELLPFAKNPQWQGILHGLLNLLKSRSGAGPSQ